MVMTRSTKGLVLLSIFLLSLSGLYFYLGTVEPESKFIMFIEEKDEGKIVLVEGVVNDLTFKKDSSFFDLVDPDDGEHIRVFCEFGISRGLRENLVPGARVEVIGVVTIYDHELEIEVKKEGDLELKAYPEANHVGMNIIYQNKEVFDNMTAVVRGTVKDLRLYWGDLSFVLEDGANRAMVRVTDHSPQIPFEDGGCVGVVGKLWFDDDGVLHISAVGWRAVTVGP